MATTEINASSQDRSGNSRPWFVPVIVLVVLAAIITLAAWPTPPVETAGPALVPGVPGDVGIEPRLDEPVPLDLTFLDEQGREVRLGALVRDKPVVLNLMYFRCPMLCNMVMDGMIRTLTTMRFQPGSEFTVVTVSFDHRENPEMAAAAKQTAIGRYGREESAAGWHFLTGNEANIRQLTDAVGFQFSFDEERGQYAHGAGLFVLTPQGKVSRFLSGVEFGARDLRLALVEASENKIGEATDHVLLLCYQYDPSKGKYGLAILGVIRLAGVTTVLVMVCGFAVLMRRERRAENPRLPKDSSAPDAAPA